MLALASAITSAALPNSTFNTPLEMHERAAALKAPRAAVVLSILHWRCYLLNQKDMDSGKNKPFNTPLEMPCLSLISDTQQDSFQYSVGDAFSRALQPRHSLDICFQYSVGDAVLECRLFGNKVPKLSFNTPLEMPARPRGRPVHEGNCFQYSVGDARLDGLRQVLPGDDNHFQYSVGDAKVAFRHRSKATGP